MSIGSTAIEAVLFEPVLSRAQRAANRLVFGSRATPYEVLADLAQRMSRAEPHAGLLDRMAERLAAGTGADRAVVWARDEGVWSPVAAHPAPKEHAVDSREDVPGMVVSVVDDGSGDRRAQPGARSWWPNEPDRATAGARPRRLRRTGTRSCSTRRSPRRQGSRTHGIAAPSARCRGVEVGDLGELPEPVAVAAYFTISEALTNAIKHECSDRRRGQSLSAQAPASDSGPNSDFVMNAMAPASSARCSNSSGP